MTATQFLHLVASRPDQLKADGLRIDYDEPGNNKVAAMELYVVLKCFSAHAKAILREQEEQDKQLAGAREGY